MSQYRITIGAAGNRPEVVHTITIRDGVSESDAALVYGILTGERRRAEEALRVLDSGVAAAVTAPCKVVADGPRPEVRVTRVK